METHAAFNIIERSDDDERRSGGNSIWNSWLAVPMGRHRLQCPSISFPGSTVDFPAETKSNLIFWIPCNRPIDEQREACILVVYGYARGHLVSTAI